MISFLISTMVPRILSSRRSSEVSFTRDAWPCLMTMMNRFKLKSDASRRTNLIQYYSDMEEPSHHDILAQVAQGSSMILVTKQNINSPLVQLHSSIPHLCFWNFHYLTPTPFLFSLNNHQPFPPLSCLLQTSSTLLQITFIAVRIIQAPLAFLSHLKKYTMSAPLQSSSHSRTAYVEDSEDEFVSSRSFSRT